MINVPMNAVPAMMPTPMPVQGPEEKQYNAVAITVHKPTVETVANNQNSPYVYPQASVYSYPAASIYGMPTTPAQAEVQPTANPAMLAVPAEQTAQEIVQPQTYQVPESVLPESKPVEQLPASTPVEPVQQTEDTLVEQPKEVIAQA